MIDKLILVLITLLASAGIASCNDSSTSTLRRRVSLLASAEAHHPPHRELQNTSYCSGDNNGSTPCTSDAECITFLCSGGSTPEVECTMNDDCLDQGLCEASYGTCDSVMMHSTSTSKALDQNSASVSRALLPNLVIVAHAPPLGECEGDCDNDGECMDQLVCYKRGGYESVPGCSGTGIYRKDYCCNLPPNNLFFIGNNLLPVGSGLYGLCEGDCDTDADCAGTLICEDRSGSEAVLGCVGEGWKGADYCRRPDGIIPPTAKPTSKPTAKPTAKPTPKPTPKPTMSPVKSPVESPTKRPTKSPTKGPTESPTKRPTKSPTKSPTTGSPTARLTVLTIIANPTGPLANCQGDCDDDGDCKADLVCYQRRAYETVPGCTGLGVVGEDYCCNRPQDYLFYIGNNEGIGMYGLCEGDCDTNADCAGTLICDQRSGFTPVPGCDGSGREGKDYCRSSGPTPSPKPTPLSPTPLPTPPITPSPSKKPIASPPPPPSYYKYTDVGTTCSKRSGKRNYQGPAPLADKTNVALQFFAFGDTPHDSACNICNTCIGTNGAVESDCGRFDCILKTSSLDNLSSSNTCTYEGPEYACVRDTLIPYMNEKIAAGDAAFSVHIGDILKGAGGISGNKRCTQYSLASRKALFSPADNFLLLPGDNDWNECWGYNVNSNTDFIREHWRDNFANSNSPLYGFGVNFPATPGFTGGSKPTVSRLDPDNPEIFYFRHNNVAVFGLNHVAKTTYLKGTSINEDWVANKLSLDAGTCTLESIILLSQTDLYSSVFAKVNDYFAACGGITLPILTIMGDLHPANYCMTKTSNTRLDLMVEAFRSGPLLVSVVRDPTGNGGDFFHIDDADPVDSNNRCPSFDNLANLAETV